MNAVVPVASTGPNPTGGGKQMTPSSVPKAAGAFSFMPIKSQKKPQFIKALIYGLQGSGKTTLAGSACNIDEASDVLLITAEGGDIVFENNARIKRPERIDFLKVNRIEQLQKVYEWLHAHVGFRDANDEARLHKLQNIAFFGDQNITKEQAYEMHPDFDFERVRKYRTVIIDSLTDVEAQNMNHILGIDDAKGFELGGDLTPPGYTEFRKNNNTMQQLVRAFRNLPVHLLLICTQKYNQDEMKRFHYNPSLTGQLSGQVQGFVDLVGYMVISQTDPSQPSIRRLYVQPQAAVRFDAKCRIANYDKPAFDDPTFADILRECGYMRTQVPVGA